MAFVGGMMGAAPPPPPPPPPPPLPPDINLPGGAPYVPQPMEQPVQQPLQQKAQGDKAPGEKAQQETAFPAIFPTTCAGWNLKMLPAEYLASGQKPSWQFVHRTDMVFTSDELMPLVMKYKVKNKKIGRTVEDDYNDIKNEHRRAQIDRLLSEQNAKERNPNAVWKLACLETDNRDVGRRRTEAVRMRVILKREQKDRSKKYEAPKIISRPGTGVVVDANEPYKPSAPKPKSPQSQAPAQPHKQDWQPQTQAQPFFDMMPPPSGWAENFSQPPPPPPPPPHGPTSMNNPQIPLGAFPLGPIAGPPPGPAPGFGLPAVPPHPPGDPIQPSMRTAPLHFQPPPQPIPIPNQGKPRKAAHQHEPSSSSDMGSDYDDSIGNEEDPIVTIIDEGPSKLKRSKTPGPSRSRGRSHDRATKSPHHPITPPPIGPHRSKSREPKRDYQPSQSPRHIRRQHSFQEIIDVPDNRHLFRKEVTEKVGSWALDDVYSSSYDSSIADAGNSDFSRAGESLFTGSSSPPSPRALYIPEYDYKRGSLHKEPRHHRHSRHHSRPVYREHEPPYHDPYPPPEVPAAPPVYLVRRNSHRDNYASDYERGRPAPPRRYTDEHYGNDYPHVPHRPPLAGPPAQQVPRQLSYRPPQHVLQAPPPAPEPHVWADDNHGRGRRRRSGYGAPNHWETERKIRDREVALEHKAMYEQHFRDATEMESGWDRRARAPYYN